MKAQLQATSFYFGKRPFAVFATLFLAWVYCPLASAQRVADDNKSPQNKKAEANIPYTRDEAMRMMAAVFAALDPSLPENQYLPAFARDKVGWVLEENKAQRFAFTLKEEADFTSGGSGSVTAPMFLEGKPAIRFYLQRLVNIGMPDFRAGQPFSRGFINILYYAVTHEELHLELGQEKFLQLQTREQNVQEEMRVWALCSINLVRPLAGQKQLLIDELWQADRLLRACGDDWEHCQAFRTFIEPRVS